MDETQKEVEQVEKKKSNVLSGIRPNWWIWIILICVFIIAFLPNKMIYLAGLIGVIILISRGKDSTVKSMSEKQAKAIIDNRIEEMRKTGEIPSYVVVKRSFVCYMKSLSDHLKYIFGGLTFYYPDMTEEYYMWTVWITEPLYAVPFFQKSEHPVTGNEYPTVQIPAIFKKMLKERKLSTLWGRDYR